jgi:hypothetical protein
MEIRKFNLTLLFQFSWAYFLIHIYLFAMYTPIITLKTNISFYIPKKYYKVLLLDNTSFQFELFKKLLMFNSITFFNKSTKSVEFKKLKYILALTRIFCFISILTRIVFKKKEILFDLNNFFEMLQLMIGTEYGLYILYLFEYKSINIEFQNFVIFLRFIYFISFIFKIQKINYKIPILLLVPENYFNLNFKGTIKKKIFFNQIIIMYIIFFYFFWLFLIKIVYNNKNFIKNLKKNYYFFQIKIFLEITRITIKHISLLYTITQYAFKIKKYSFFF